MRTLEPQPKSTQQPASAKAVTAGRARLGARPEANSFLHLHRTAGNQAVQRLFETRAGGCGSVSGTTATPRFDVDSSRMPAQSGVPLAVQSIPDTRRSSHVTSARHAGDGEAAHHSSGAPLGAEVRARCELAFGTSLTDVRIHADARAAASADALDADAYAVGRDIFFGAGRYQPGSLAGKRLLAHELAHVVQQRAKAPGRAVLPVSRPGDPAEREADDAAEALVAGRPVHVTTRPETLAIHRKPKQMRRADRLLPTEKAQLGKLGRGELDDLVDQIIADGKYHQIQQQTINGVEHTWEVRTEIDKLSEEEREQGPKFAGALKPETDVVSPDGKKVLHPFLYVLRSDSASSIKSVLHELIHLRISIDRSLPAEQRSSFFREYSQLNEMTEVMPGTGFGASGRTGQKSSYGALAIASGQWERVKTVLDRMEALRSLYIAHDASAEARFDSDPTVAPATLIEFIVQEKYVTQTTARSASGAATSNDTVATRYGRAVDNRFAVSVSAAALKRISDSPVGTKQHAELADRLRLAIQRLYGALDLSLREAKEFKKNPPKPPANMPDPVVFEVRPVGIGGEPIPLK